MSELPGLPAVKIWVAGLTDTQHQHILMVLENRGYEVWNNGNDFFDNMNIIVSRHGTVYPGRVRDKSTFLYHPAWYEEELDTNELLGIV